MFDEAPTFYVGADIIHGLRIFYVGADIFMDLEYFMGANISWAPTFHGRRFPQVILILSQSRAEQLE
jgi:hypothetical protein